MNSWVPTNISLSIYQLFGCHNVTFIAEWQEKLCKRHPARVSVCTKLSSCKTLSLPFLNSVYWYGWQSDVGQIGIVSSNLICARGWRSSKSDCCNSVPMHKIVSFHRRIANPPIPSHGGCRHLKHSKHWTYNAVLGTSSLTKMDEFPIQKHYIEATFDHKRKHRKHKCQHFS